MREPKTNIEWREWGRRDPFFGVANWTGKDIDGSDPWTPEEFYALGEMDWRDYEERWRKYGLKTTSFVEIGCGAGRITRPLAEAFDRGYAIDVSADMIRCAASHVVKKNVSWHATRGFEIPLADNCVDAAFSCHVFQHLPSVEAGMAYFRELARVLKPGGSFMIHLPFYVFPTHESRKFAMLCNALYHHVLWPIYRVKFGFLRFRMKLGGKPPMHGVSYDLYELDRFLQRVGFIRIEFTTFSVTSNGSLHSFVMATKPENSNLRGFSRTAAAG
jgi:SAM-dependent methyltransferase